MADATPVKMDATNGLLEVGPLVISPGGTAVVETLLLAQVPIGERTPVGRAGRPICHVENGTGD